MNINYNIFLSLGIGIILYFIGTFIGRNIRNKNLKLALLLIAFILSIPGLLMILYYLHFFKLSVWYVDLRTTEFIEVSNSFMGFFIGLLTPFRQRLFLNISVVIVLLIIPYIKPIIRPLSVTEEKGWSDNVCLQSTGATCGPSCLATIFKHFGIDKTESEIAKACYTCGSGTEIWYLLRYARSQGLNYTCSVQDNINSTRPPAIVGVKLGTIGHFITLLGRNNSNYIIGDPLNGKAEISQEQFNYSYTKLDGLIVEFYK